jgi:hypothetical protein
MYQKDLDKLNNILSNYKPNTLSYYELKKKYKNELQNYKYIDNIENFINLKKGYAIKPIKKNTEELQKGGIIVQIDKNKKNKWYVLVVLPKLNYFWRIYFEDNHIFYKSPNKFRNLFDNFITKEDLNKYTDTRTIMNDDIITIVNKYKKI